MATSHTANLAPQRWITLDPQAMDTIGALWSSKRRGVASFSDWAWPHHAELCLLLFAERGARACAQKPAPQKAAGETLTIDPAQMQKPWTGDLDGMIERRVIRVLTVNSKTFYFIDKGVLRGTVVDYFRLFEDELNKKLPPRRNSRTRT